MTTVFQLWDIQAGSAIGGYETEESAMAVVRSAFEQFGPDDVRSLALFVLEAEDLHDTKPASRPGDDQRLRLVADGETLLRRVNPHVRA